ncbi:Ribonuclease H domain [Dillenia turbinata]|uniref:Ribonuclease H domain n=1 Tax=Dillenia turbinata TaxID=194707 RepID=A0AAN8VZH9_9MAGN
MTTLAQVSDLILTRTNSEGKWILGFTINRGITDSLKVEIWGIREGLNLALKHKFHKAIMETDSQTLSILLNKGVKDSHPMQAIIAKCRHLMEKVGIQEVTHVCKEGNKCANLLANLAHSHDPGMHVFNSPPDCIKPLLLHDELGTPSIRVKNSGPQALPS